jgi:predicted membrane-bound spermidine synthase
VKHGLLLLIAGATGAAVMVLELMTVRLMAPWFGQSQVVWTNVIGIVLAALAVGQWLGGRWSERSRAAPVVLLMLGAGALSVVLPDVVALLAPLTLPADLQLDEAWPFVTYGSLLVTLLAVGLPMAALGAVTPWLVRLSREASRTPGQVTGAMLGAGTLGSLLGTFGATHVLLPGVGSAWSVRLAGALLIGAGLVLWLMVRPRPGKAALALFALLLLPLVPRDERHPAAVVSLETIYQDVRVEIDAEGTRLLRINEGLDSFHSAYRPGSLWTDRYFDAFIAPALVSPRGADGRQRVLILGLGGGTMARQIAEVAPEIVVSGVELDERLVQLGYEWFGLPRTVQVVSGMDARVALKCTSVQQGAILVDAYAQQIYVPHHLCTEEFFRELKDRLLDGGIAALNLGGRTREDPVIAAVSATFSGVFPGAVMARVPGTRNMILLGVRGGAFRHADLEQSLTRLDPTLPEARSHLGWMVDADAFAPAFGGMATPLRDQDSPVEALAHAAWRASS